MRTRTVKQISVVPEISRFVQEVHVPYLSDDKQTRYRPRPYQPIHFEVEIPGQNVVLPWSQWASATPTKRPSSYVAQEGAETSMAKMPRFNVAGTTGDQDAVRKRHPIEDVYLRIQYRNSSPGLANCYRTVTLASSRTQWPPSPRQLP